ncbi:MAG: SRPBCC family protein [Gammaproteobacteria bacterium]|nr:SRPBCC family protein [Gammaproteobacteria bacterium]
MIEYHLVSNWKLNATVDQVWAILDDPATWPQWWPCWQSVEVRPNQAIRVGSRINARVHGKLPYSLPIELEVSHWDAPALSQYSCEGSLSGSGACRISNDGVHTEVEFDWNVGTTNWLFNLLGRLGFIKKMIRNNHAFVMAQGQAGIDKRLAARS